MMSFSSGCLDPFHRDNGVRGSRTLDTIPFDSIIVTLSRLPDVYSLGGGVEDE